MNSETSSARNITIDCECLQKTDSKQHFINENFIQSQLSINTMGHLIALIPLAFMVLVI